MAKGVKPDPILVKDQLQLLQSMHKAWGAEAYSRYMVWILGKREDKKIAAKGNARTHSNLIPFKWNRTQRDVFSRKGKRNICLKARQVGLTTWFLMEDIYVPSTITPGTNALLISQTGADATKHFAMLRRAHKYYGAQDPGNPQLNTLTKSLHENLLHTSYSNRKELILDQLDNTIHIASAEVEEAGQGLTLHRVVGSEVARWPGDAEETLANLKEAIVIEGTLSLESTANGAYGYFFEEYFRAKRGDSDFVAHFNPWWLDDDYKIILPTKEEQELEQDLESDEIQLREMFHLTLTQIAFRREKQKSLRHNFDEKYPEDDVTAFLVSGSGFFDKDIMRARLLELQNFKPYTSFSGGAAAVLKKRIPGRKYILACDAASGKRVGSNLDSSAGKVIDQETGEEVAKYINQVSPEDFALDMAELGTYFNNALIAVERGTGADSGGDGGSVLMTLINNRYPNIYYHQEFFRAKDGKKKVDKYPGFPTTGGTRPIILNKLRFMLENFPELFWDIDLIRQALLFVRDERGRPSAQEGAHDDMVLASAIAQGVRLIVLGLWDPLVRRSQRYGSTPVGEEAEEELA